MSNTERNINDHDFTGPIGDGAGTGPELPAALADRLRRAYAPPASASVPSEMDDRILAAAREVLASKHGEPIGRIRSPFVARARWWGGGLAAAAGVALAFIVLRPGAPSTPQNAALNGNRIADASKPIAASPDLLASMPATIARDDRAAKRADGVPASRRIVEPAGEMPTLSADAVAGAMPPASPAGRITPADIDADGVIDIVDALALARAVSAGGGGAAGEHADINHDGVIDTRDALALASAVVTLRGGAL